MGTARGPDHEIKPAELADEALNETQGGLRINHIGDNVIIHQFRKPPTATLEGYGKDSLMGGTDPDRIDYDKS